MIQNYDCAKTKDDWKHEFWNIGAGSSNVDEEGGDYYNVKQLNYLCFIHCIIYTNEFFVVDQFDCERKIHETNTKSKGRNETDEG